MKRFMDMMQPFRVVENSGKYTDECNIYTRQTPSLHAQSCSNNILDSTINSTCTNTRVTLSSPKPI